MKNMQITMMIQINKIDNHLIMNSISILRQIKAILIQTKINKINNTRI
jgi:hypothetical protein